MLRKLPLFFIFFFLTHCIFSQNDSTEVNRLNKLAWEVRSANLDTSISLSTKALTLLNQVSKKTHFVNNWNEKAYVKTYYYLGYFYSQQGEITTPLDYYNKALKISNDIHYEYGLSLAYGGIGTFYLDRGNFTKALDYLFLALRIDEKRGHKEGMLVRLSNIGNIYTGEKEYAKALEYFLKALKLAEEIKSKKHISIIYSNLGIVYYYLQDSKKALYYYLNSLKIDREIGNKNGISLNLNNIGSLYKDDKDYDKAYAYFSEALTIAREQGNGEMIASELGNLGIIFTLKKEYPKAEDYLLQSMKMIDEMNVLDAKNDFELALSELYSAWGKDKLALEHYKKHIIARDSIYNHENTEKAVRTELNYEFDKKQAVEKEQHEKEIIAFEAENRLQKQLHVFLLVFIALILLLLFFVKRAYDNKKRVAGFLADEAQRKETLLQEVHHRINNNLQIISSLLTLQANSAEDERLNDYLQQSQNRIQSLSALHELLYQNDSPLEINMKEYIDKVLDFHRDILKTRALNVSISVDITPATFPTKTAVPIALIVNELVTNSIKYAFEDSNGGKINISLQPTEGKKEQWILVVSDNGKGLPAETGMRENSLGLRLVNIMTKQMGALLTKNNLPGASFSLSFSLPSAS